MLDAVVVGAGAAGVGAGLALLKHRANFLILEAKDRVGGRAFSDSESLGRTWDHGCHWFHSASINPLRKIALKLGHPFEDMPKPYGSWLWRNGAFMDPTPYETEHAALAARMAATDTATTDMALATLMDDASPWRAVLRHDMALTYSQEVEDISVADAKAFHDTQENIPVTGGYGALVARLAQALPVRRSTAVTAITVVPGGVKVSTASGDIEARQVIVAVPQRVLARGAIRFSPALPADIEHAIGMLPMGWFEKSGVAFSAPVFGEHSELRRGNRSPRDG
ncbi:flavin monoamine oxidase family protein [Aestuariivirga sp.]|uniref:flavin monoamine oxidase family protein n=1 Tax=Aestuariivirga sp. TaxID=2650926 RepID=UPI0039E60E46